jgi:LPXTG-site transpeptidase (sortase) family protein
MKHFFKIHEIQFLLWTSGIFLISVVVLSLTGLVPSEFKMGGGETFEQKTRTAVRDIIEGRPSSNTFTRAGNISQDGDAQGTNMSDQSTRDAQSYSQAGGSGNGSGVNSTGGGVGTGGTLSQGVIESTLPVRLKIPSISVDTPINNPKSTTFEVLDSALTTGAVRYPGSGSPGIGNMFIFGHSTGFSIVQNPAYKIFNSLRKVSEGDAIYVYTQDAVFEYRVTSLVKVDKDKALVEFDTQKNMITLSTCDSFGRPQDRYVVEADFISATRL